MKPSEILTRAADLIEPPGAWGKGQGTRNPEGCHCVLSAITAADTSGFMSKAWSDAIDFLEQVIGPGACAYKWNDAPERTQAEVVAATRAAAELAKQQEVA